MSKPAPLNRNVYKIKAELEKMLDSPTPNEILPSNKNVQALFLAIFLIFFLTIW